jgi:hypothetical protein
VLSPEIDDRGEVEVANWANVVTFFFALRKQIYSSSTAPPLRQSFTTWCISLSFVHFKLSVFAKVRNNDVLMESFSDEEEEEISNGGPGDEAPSEVRELLCRKVELERTQRRQELHKQRVKVIARAAIVKISN